MAMPRPTLRVYSVGATDNNQIAIPLSTSRNALVGFIAALDPGPSARSSALSTAHPSSTVAPIRTAIAPPARLTFP